ncbi:MAG: AgmX/PglI C-terminal domain-containing protein [Deltaproteobacteria bacterium]|nr:MAG: AgmX/PglI C-terminal domain-containing protein [Deltaproteobacteria bacterium]
MNAVSAHAGEPRPPWAPTALRATLIWHDEVMEDLVLDKPRRVTIGPHRRSTFVLPEIGLPRKFAIVRPGNRGYLLTLGERMRGTICIAGKKQEIADLVQRESAGGFCAVPISGRDWGVIDLDESGHYKLFFQFVAVDEPPQFFTRQVVISGLAGWVIAGTVLSFLIRWWAGIELDEAALRGSLLSTGGLLGGGIGWRLIRQDPFMTYQLYDGENPFVWPGPRALTGNYLVTRLDREEPPEPKPVPTIGNTQQQQPAPPTKDPPKNTATKGNEGRAGGKGDTERARDPNAKDVPPEPPRVGVFEDKNRKVLDNIIDRNLATSLSKFTGIQSDTLNRGSLGFGPGVGTGVGPGEGTGTKTGSKGGGSGGGGNVAGDFNSGPGKIDTGGNRPGGGNCKGTGCGSGPRTIQVAFAEPSGDFGGLTAEEIDRVVKASRGLFRACYQKELNHTPGIGGKLVVHFRIGGDGRVQSANTATASGTTLHNDAVEQCVKRNINTMLYFPAKGGIANVNYPFVFTQGG